jgi:integrase
MSHPSPQVSASVVKVAANGLPLWKTTATALRAWLAIRGPGASPELFVNARGEPFSRWGVAYVLRCHADAAQRKCTMLLGKQGSPHVLRHSAGSRTMPGQLKFGLVGGSLASTFPA